ncbi:MAG: filamentous hemagglutinin, partial [Gammaproteobacteria bacterium]
MNKRCYKVVFSKTMNRLIVVSEWAKSGGKSDNRTQVTHSGGSMWVGRFAMQRLSAGILLGLGLAFLSPAAASDIVADGSAPANQQPVILSTASGVTQ